MDIRVAPWNALARVQTNLGGRCTGVLVAPETVLTAAHCLFNARTGRLLPASSLHVLFGYDRGAYTVHATVQRFVAGATFDGRRPGATLADDWALLTLDAKTRIPAEPLAVSRSLPPVGAPVVAAGFSQDRSHVLMADQDCRVIGHRAVGTAFFLLHDCAATRGTSGGPLLARIGEQWEVVGVNVAAGPDGNLSLGAGTFAGRLPSPAP